MIRASLFLFGLAVAVAFWPGTLEYALSARWMVIALGAPLFLLAQRSLPSPALPLAVLALFTMTLAWVPVLGNPVEEWAHLLALGAVFWLGMALSDAGPIWAGLAAGVALNGALAIGQQFFGLDYATTTPGWPSGTFANKNFLAEAGLVALVVACAMRLWWLVPLAVAAWVLPESRAALGAGVATFALFWLHPRKPAVARVLLLALVAGAALGMTFGSGADRWRIWSEAAAGLTLFGHGLGSYAENFEFFAYVHNEPLQLIYELGVLSVPVFGLGAWLFAREVVHAVPLEASALFSILAVGCFAFPLHLPVTAFAAALAGGRMAGVRLQLRRSPFRQRVYFGQRDGWPTAFFAGGARRGRLGGGALAFQQGEVRLARGAVGGAA